jgi:hypothetical protein
MGPFCQPQTRVSSTSHPRPIRLPPFSIVIAAVAVASHVLAFHPAKPSTIETVATPRPATVVLVGIEVAFVIDRSEQSYGGASHALVPPRPQDVG